MAHTSAADLAHALKGAHFPMNTRQLAEHARKNKAPGDVVKTVEEMPDREFHSLADVEHVFSQSQKHEPPKSGKATGEARKGGAHRSSS